MFEINNFPQLNVIWAQIVAVLSTISLSDILDILIVAFIVYKLISILQNTRAGQLIKGVFILLLLFFLAIMLNLKMLDAILRLVVTYGAFALIVIFQPELRSVLEKLGRSSVQFLPQKNHEQADVERHHTKILINSVCNAVASMSSKKVGALIVLERMTKLGEIIGTGTLIDAEPSTELIENIFFHNSPLHDGALIIRDERLHAAACYLPLSQNYDINRNYGTRHRAALGITESSDAMVVVVSEETGHISLVMDGTIKTDITESSLKTTMYRAFIPVEKVKKKARWNVFDKIIQKTVGQDKK